MPPPAPTWRQVLRRWVHLVIFLVVGMLIGLVIGFVITVVEENNEVVLITNYVSILIGDVRV